MAGISAQRIRDIIHKINPEISVPVIRIMPNTPCAIGAGASALSYDGDVSEEDIAYAKRFAECVGKCEVVPTRCYNAAAVVGGCTPGWAFMFIEALADGGVAAGLGRNESLRLAAQSVMGAAKMVLESGEHPGALKDKVCSPGGTTIEGLRVLENRGFRSAVIDAVVGATEKADRMGNKKD
ncbi:unnamed protein product [Caenorhabditis auriculariae]|uniref:pyrroline-5-carboxylate reductase n=1 Tax=Caenorhabditis auriculariae TaxID=2777116 RepID=A0A8S1HEI2_9PELO|nr:unnamed protein product [Caenorhabditis auriculariae]